MELGYAGNTGQKLPQRYNLNAGRLDPTNTIPLKQRQPFPQFNYILFADNDGWSSYEGFTARYEHRFAQGLYLLGSYTWQKALDLGATDDFTMISADFKKFDKGHTAFDVPHRFVLSYTYELPDWPRKGPAWQFFEVTGRTYRWVAAQWHIDVFCRTISHGYDFCVLAQY